MQNVNLTDPVNHSQTMQTYPFELTMQRVGTNTVDAGDLMEKGQLLHGSTSKVTVPGPQRATRSDPSQSFDPRISGMQDAGVCVFISGLFFALVGFSMAPAKPAPFFAGVGLMGLGLLTYNYRRLKLMTMNYKIDLAKIRLPQNNTVRFSVQLDHRLTFASYKLAQTQLKTAHSACEIKTTQYTQLAQQHSADFIPFAVEFWGLSNNAVNLVNEM